MINLTCKQCNKEFSVHDYRAEKAKCCNQKCYLEWLHSRPVSVKTRKKMSLARSDEKHPFWKGENTSYRSLHRWVQKKLGKAKQCEFCGKKKTTPKSIHWANRSGLYLRNLLDWLELCVPCHSAYDKGRNSIIGKYAK